MPGVIIRDKEALDGISHELAACGHIVVMVTVPAVGEVEVKANFNPIECGSTKAEPLAADILFPGPVDPASLCPMALVVAVERWWDKGYGEPDLFHVSFPL